MHIYFCGIGGSGLGPLAELALAANLKVSGSDSAASLMTDALQKQAVNISFDQSGQSLKDLHTNQPIDWLVHTAAVDQNHPELKMAQQLNIRTSKRDEFINQIINQKKLKLIAVAGTHGKTTVASMLIWLFKQLNLPISYLVGAPLKFASSGHFDARSQYFIYECDEYDRNFLHFWPYLSLITNIDFDHPDVFADRQDYLKAFRQFARQSQNIITGQSEQAELDSPTLTINQEQLSNVKLAGKHNRQNGALALAALQFLKLGSNEQNQAALRAFPGAQRRFELIVPNLYSDYAHHPTEIAASLQLAHELAAPNKQKIVLIYQPHQNVRQQQIKDLYQNKVFKHAEQIYWLETYLTRKDSALTVLSPQELSAKINPAKITFAKTDQALWQKIQNHLQNGDLVVAMGAGTIDNWLRHKSKVDSV